VASIPAGAATLILVGPTIALRPLLADWQQTDPMTVVGSEANRRSQAQG
jgi:hypothetical protein